MQITYSTKHRTFRSQNHISLDREKNDGWSWIAPLWRVCWLKKKTKFIDPNDTLQNHKLAPIWILRTIIRHIDKSALILNGNSIPHRRIWKFLNDDDDERNIWNQPWKMDSTEIIGNDDYRKSFKELDLEVTRIECVVPIPDPFGLKVAIAINGHSSDIFFFKMEK